MSDSKSQHQFWSWLERITHLTVPLLVAWGIWVTNTLYAHSEGLARLRDWRDIGPRLTSADAERLRYQILHEVNGKLEHIQADIMRIKTLLESQIKTDTAK